MTIYHFDIYTIMKFGKEVELGKDVTREFFTWLPYWHNGEYRWLEKIKVFGYWSKTYIYDDLEWNHREFVDDDK